MPVSLTKKQLEGLVRDTVKDAVKEMYGANYDEVASHNIEEMSKIKEETESIKKDITGKEVSDAGIFVSAFVMGGGDLDKGSKIAKQWGREDIAKDMTATEYTQGGALIPPRYSAEIIELLYNMTLMRKMGATVVPLNGSLTIPRITAGTNAQYVGENQQAVISGMQVGDIKFDEKILMALVPVSNKLIRNAGVTVSNMVTTDIASSMAVVSDGAFIRSAGTEHSPKGLRFRAHADNVFAQTGTGITDIDADVTKAMYLVSKANIPFLRRGWLMSIRTELYLKRLRDSNGNAVFRDEMNQGLFWGAPYLASNQIPDNLDSTKSEIYYGDFAQFIIAESPNLELAISDTASYLDASNNLHSAFGRNETVVRAISYHDFNIRHDKAVSVITGVTLGA